MYQASQAVLSIQSVKGELHDVWLELVNAYRLVPHQLIDFALEFIYIPNCIKTLVSNKFRDQTCLANQYFVTGWQQLQLGIAMVSWHPLRCSLLMQGRWSELQSG